MLDQFVNRRPFLQHNQEVGIISTFFTEQMLMRDFSILKLKPENYIEIILEKRIEVVFIDSHIYETDNVWFDYEIQQIINMIQKVDVNIVIVNNDEDFQYLKGNNYFINVETDRNNIEINENILSIPILLNENLFNPINDKPKLDITYFNIGELRRGKAIQGLHVKYKPKREEIVVDEITRRTLKEIVRKIKNSKVFYIYYSEVLTKTMIRYLEIAASLQNTVLILDARYDFELSLGVNTKVEESNIELVSAFYRNGIYRDKINIKNHRTAFLNNTLIQYQNLNEVIHGEERRKEVNISIITSTKRKWTLDAYIERLNKQNGVMLQVILLTHGFSLTDKEKEILSIKANFDITIIDAPTSKAFGLCLNSCIELAEREFFTKIDDDDYYYSNYLLDSWIAKQYSNADIVGKHSQFVFLEDNKMVIQRFNNQQYKFSEYVAGATIFCETNFIKKYLFSNLQKAVDSDLLRRVREDSGKIYCIHPYEFCIFRAGDKSEHTWQVDDVRLLKSAKIHFIGDPEDTIEVQ